jgi:hypothetical protein
MNELGENRPQGSDRPTIAMQQPEILLFASDDFQLISAIISW